MKYLIKDINKNEKEILEKKGLYCYDLRESDTGDEVANIEKNVFVNKVGNMITNEKIEFDKTPNDFVNYFDFCMKNEQVDKIEDLLESRETNKKIQRTRQLDNGIYVVDLGYRNDTPVALVEREVKNYPSEYIIAFNYEIKDNKMDWGYGYYYGQDILKAKEDFKKVLAGKNLADTFSNKNKNKRKDDR